MQGEFNSPCMECTGPNFNLGKQYSTITDYRRQNETVRQMNDPLLVKFMCHACSKNKKRVIFVGSSFSLEFKIFPDFVFATKLFPHNKKHQTFKEIYEFTVTPIVYYYY